jgi:hypothetical protein
MTRLDRAVPRPHRPWPTLEVRCRVLAASSRINSILSLPLHSLRKCSIFSSGSPSRIGAISRGRRLRSVLLRAARQTTPRLLPSRSASQRTGRLRFGKETTFMRQLNRVMAGRPRPFVKLRIFAKAGVVLPRPNAREGRHSRALPILSRGVGRRRYRPQLCQLRLPARAS